MKQNSIFLMILSLLLFCSISLYSATITIPSLELITRGMMVGSNFVISTDGNMDMLILGGDKFAGEVVLGFTGENIEEQINAEDTLKGLAFKGANISVNNIFSTPLTFSYFIGNNDNLCSGEDFDKVFNVAPIITNYNGAMYFTGDFKYNGINPIAGTGIQLALAPLANFFYSSIYVYQDSHFPTTGIYSADLRAMLNFDTIQLELFGGGSYPVSQFGYYRAGLLFNAMTPAGTFLMQVGVPRYDPAVDTLGIQLFYILFEVNISLGVLTIIPSVFMHPGYYTQVETSEQGIIDVNLNLKFGDIQKNLVCGGLENNLSFEDASVEGLTIKVAPYLKLASPGVIWQFKLNTQVFPFPALDKLFEGYVGIKAVF